MTMSFLSYIYNILYRPILGFSLRGIRAAFSGESKLPQSCAAQPFSLMWVAILQTFCHSHIFCCRRFSNIHMPAEHSAFAFRLNPRIKHWAPHPQPHPHSEAKETDRTERTVFPQRQCVSEFVFSTSMLLFASNSEKCAFFGVSHWLMYLFLITL